MRWRLYCKRCGLKLEPARYEPLCPRCGSPLELEGVLPKLFKSILGEGNTPAVLLDYRGVRVIVKLEYLNPTGSFKDRGVSYSLHLAKNLGYHCVVEDSSGNTAISVAAYAKALGLKARIYIPRTAGKGKVNLVKAIGAQVELVKSRDEAATRVMRDSRRCFYVAHAYSPIFIEGIKSLASELKEYSRATYIVPVSSGTLILGLYRGFKESGITPRLVAVQASEASPLRGRVELLAETGGPTSKLADALVLKNPPRLDDIVDAINSSKGGVVIVGDEAIKTSLRKLLSLGFIVEPSSAVAWAALDKLIDLGYSDEFVVILTGSGLKYHEVLTKIAWR